MKLRPVRYPRIITLALGSFVVVAGVAWFAFRKETPTTIPSVSGESLNLPPIATPHFLQSDSQWAKDEIGGSRESLSRVGCAVCCVAMVLNSYGVELNPAQLNSALKGVQGYTPAGLLKWDAISDISNGKVRPDYIGPPNSRKIDEALKNGQPVIAKVMLKNIVQHWVLIVGKEGSHYLIRDPLKEDLTRLSAIANNIHAIRILKTTDL